jgi:hypothetical protein
MSHLNDVGVSRHIDGLLCAYILSRNLRRSAPGCTEKRMLPTSSVSALTVCARASNEDAVLGPIKFNDLPQMCKLITEPMIEP